MKYFVTIAGREIAVQVDGDQVTVDGRQMPAHLWPVPGTPMRQLLLGTVSLPIIVERGETGTWQLSVEGVRHEITVVDQRTRHIAALAGSAGTRKGPAILKAPMPGLVVRILVTPGQTVEPGSGLVVLEAMKMENELRATTAGVVQRLAVEAGQPVEKGQPLVEFAP